MLSYKQLIQKAVIYVGGDDFYKCDSHMTCSRCPFCCRGQCTRKCDENVENEIVVHNKMTGVIVTHQERHERLKLFF